MYKYNINFINTLIVELSNNTLNTDVDQYLNSILTDIIKTTEHHTYPKIYNNNNNKNNTNNNNNNYNKNNYKNNKNNNNNNNNNNYIKRKPDFNNTNNRYTHNFRGAKNAITASVNENNSKSLENISLENKSVNENDSKSLENINFENISVNENDSKSLENINYDNKKPLISTYISNRMKDINNKSNHDLAIINIRKILNKITNQTYNKLKTEFTCYYSSLLCNDKYESSADDLNLSADDLNLSAINLFIFENLVYNNKLFSELYCDLYYSLSILNKDFIDILNNNLHHFVCIHKNILLPENATFDAINISNKHNDKYECFCYFYINCFKINMININIIYETLNNLQNELLIHIKLENFKNYCEIITDYIFLLISNIYKLIDQEKDHIPNFNKIYENIKNISKLNNKSFASVSNKTIFKHMNIVDKFL
jgi:hypothetical protein